MAFHPGYYIAGIIEDMGISQTEFATRLGTTGKTLSQLVNGQINLSNELAKKLSVMMGTSIELWLNLQNTYDQKVIEIEQEKELDEQDTVAKQIDYSYFEKEAGLPAVSSIREKVLNLCKYFMISDLRILKEPDFLVNFRTGINTVEEKNIINSRAWIQTAINKAKEINTEPFDSKKLTAYLPKFREMTVQDPSVFYPRMKELFAECGVSFVLLPHLKNSGVNGAVKWINANSVVLAMNNRGLDADKFWFSLFHEIKHVLQQKIKTVFINAQGSEMQDMNETLEAEADSFASSYLIPEVKLKEFAPNSFTSDNDILRFAESIGIHPGVVVGRLQHEKIIAPSRGNSLKQKYYII